MTRSPPQLGVNIDHVATVRQARGTPYPDLREAAHAARAGGADAITVHLREDRRHIQDDDVRMLRSALDLRLNLELAATTEMIEIACAIGPDVCCLVPERRAELTTEGGLDVRAHAAVIGKACARLAAAGIEVSLFVDPDPAQIAAAAAAGAPTIELHTGHFALATGAAASAACATLGAAVEVARGQGLKVNAGHGLHYGNVAAIAALPDIHELNIGHAIVARALFVGLERAVLEMKQAMHAALR